MKTEDGNVNWGEGEEVKIMGSEAGEVEREGTWGMELGGGGEGLELKREGGEGKDWS